jgi:hypothetical protein
MWTIIWLTLAAALAAYAGYRYFYAKRDNTTANDPAKKPVGTVAPAVVEPTVAGPAQIVQSVADVNQDQQVDLALDKKAKKTVAAKAKKTAAAPKPRRAKKITSK